MPIHFGARLHAFAHGLFGSKDEAETRQLYKTVATLLDRYGLRDPEERDEIIAILCESVAAEFSISPQDSNYASIAVLVARLCDFEGYWFLPEIDFEAQRSTSQWWELREQLNVQRALVTDFENTFDFIRIILIELIRPIVEDTTTSDNDRSADDLSIKTTLLHRLGDVSGALDTVLTKAFANDVIEDDLFIRLRDQLERNLIVASGGNLADPKTFTRAPVLPTKSNIKDPSQLAEHYLQATPLIDFVQQPVDFTIPTKTRFEHMHIVAGSGHGKTQTLQYLISQDLDAVAKGQRSVVVIDSQGDLIRNISQLAEFAPGGPLHDRVVIIDPTDVEWPVSLNLFDVGIERLKDYDPLERERLTNSILELYDFVLGSLLDAQMTQKQNVIFRYVTRLMLHIPNATIHTLRELMEPDSHIKFADDIAKLSGTAKRFFETEFMDREFTQTKKQVLRRLWGILENQTFERMFSHPQSKLDLYKEMNAGKIILINTAKDLLKEQGTQIFGRFFIAMIAQAAQERATLPADKRLPTIVYIDEAADYFDRNIGLILSQARKYNVGMVLAHQYLGQLDPKLLEAFGANTSIKLAGGVSAKDARTLAPMLYCDAGLIESQPKGGFATYVRGVSQSAVPLVYPFGYLENMERMSSEQSAELRDIMRERFAVHYTELEAVSSEAEDDATDSVDEDEAPDEGSNDMDIEPGPEW